MKQLTGTLVYVMLDKPRDCYEKDKGQEWKAGIVLTDEDVVDAFDEEYPKQSAKKVKASEFEAIYKCPVPEGAGKNVWVITLRKNVKLSNGEPVPDKYQPRVHEQTVDKNGNKIRTDVTFTKLPGNGSKGTMSIDHWAGEKGNVARLKNILVTDMVEYVAPEGSDYVSGSEFDDDDTPVKPAASKTAAKATPAKPAAKTKPKTPADEFEDDDSPF